MSKQGSLENKVTFTAWTHSEVKTLLNTGTLKSKSQGLELYSTITGKPGFYQEITISGLTSYQYMTK